MGPDNRGSPMIQTTFHRKVSATLARMSGQSGQAGMPSPDTSWEGLEPPECAGPCQGQVTNLEPIWGGRKVLITKPFQDSRGNQL